MRRLSTSAHRKPSNFTSAPRPGHTQSSIFHPLLKHFAFTRRTYTASRVRLIIVFGAAVLSLTVCTLILRPWPLDPFPRSLADEHHDNAQHRPTSRAFRYQDYANEHAPHHTPPASHSQGYSFALHPTQEFGALVGFLEALASNSIPLTVDPEAPIDPELVLGFNTRAGTDRVSEEIESIISDTWTRNPVVIFSELHSTVAAASREVKSIISDLHLYPSPTVFEVDQRVDQDVLRPIIKRLSGYSLPIVLVGGEVLGSLTEVREAKESGQLRELVSASGAHIDGEKRKKGRKH